MTKHKHSKHAPTDREVLAAVEEMTAHDVALLKVLAVAGAHGFNGATIGATIVSEARKRAGRRDLSPESERVLRDLIAGLDPTRGFRTRSEHGGFTWSMQALRRREFVDGDDQPTEAGRAYIAARAL